MTRRLRDSGRTFPNFFIVGAAKAGTTSLWAHLRSHPEIFMPTSKEPSFFSELVSGGDLDSYLRLFDDGRGRSCVGEASTAYLTSPDSARLLSEARPDAKIVIVLRNPADRAFSLYNWMIREGFEWIESFEEALEEEARRVASPGFRRHNPQYFYNYLYYRSGLYAEQVRRYFDHFGREQILVLLFDELAADMAAATRRVCAHLGVGAELSPTPRIYNRGRVPYSARAQFQIRRATHALRRAGVPYVQWIQRAAFATNLSLARWRPATRLSTGLRAALLDRYRDDIATTAKLVERDLSGWIQPACPRQVAASDAKRKRAD